tara:strand:+ start:484 stop:1809 length:1326 start_codon:yes stop_codon:yes gene_type:complete
MSHNYLTYNNFTKSFLQIKKINQLEFLTIKEALLESMIETGASAFSVTEYMGTVLHHVIEDFHQVVETTDENILTDEATLNSYFMCVEMIYPELSVESFCNSFNSTIDKSSEDRIEEIYEILEGVDSEFNPSIKSIKSLSSIEKIEKDLNSEIIGQDKAISTITNSLKLFATGFTKHLSMFFIGTTGVGKTQLAKALTRSIYGTEAKLLKINCAEYASNHEYAKLIGSPPGYVGHGEKGILRQKADESDSWIICFDEIEKANPNIYNLLLNLLDEGNVSDSTGHLCSFENSIILFTSNVGVNQHVGVSHIGFEDGEDASFEDVLPSIKKEIDSKFPAEFRNRIDSWVYFNTLTEKDASKITSNLLKKFDIKPLKALVNHVVKHGYSKKYGARHIQRYIKSNILLKLANSILNIGLDKKSQYTFKVGVKEDDITVKTSLNKK